MCVLQKNEIDINWEKEGKRERDKEREKERKRKWGREREIEEEKERKRSRLCVREYLCEDDLLLTDEVLAVIL